MSEYHGPAGRFKRGATASSELSATALLDHPSRRRLDRQPVPASERRISDTADTMPGPLTLLPNQIEAPAFFVDDTLSIRWIADGGTDLFSRSLSHQLKTSGTRNVFNLIMRPAIKHALDDWQAFFSFVYATLRRFTTQDGVDLPVSSV